MAKAVVFDCEGPRPNADERAFFRDADPWGFILFARHCESPEAVAACIGDLRDAVGRRAPVLIDQEGGRVARMKPPVFPAHRPPAIFGALWKLDPAKARAAAQLNAFLLARMVSDLGVDFNCAPMLDVPQKDSDAQVIGDRAFAAHQDVVADLGRASIDGALDGGAIPVIKHMPGHGRALVDTHHALARTGASKQDLRAVDFAPFRALSDCPAGMTGHVVFEAYDDKPATLSKTVIGEVIRDEIGFDGLLFTDDLKMNALGGPLGARAGLAIEAGCDIALCCNYPFADKLAAAAATPALTGASLKRAQRALASRREVERGDTAAAYARLDQFARAALA
jgi:beta-N-acetylhexosaminidase